jgi:hypothetical protein
VDVLPGAAACQVTIEALRVKMTAVCRVSVSDRRVDARRLPGHELDLGLAVP